MNVTVKYERKYIINAFLAKKKNFDRVSKTWSMPGTEPGTQRSQDGTGTTRARIYKAVQRLKAS